ncbi:hypothetical protein QVD17_35536 [Tagetes erecta]|uniref:Uncharacterized protein n=1 Tax=Tagetes erecta TaxID=13708 RepID=A0AAD8K3M1_TARER|nr:hypothetical protein QVD17_35536 [Tagetes erecta]
MAETPTKRHRDDSGDNSGDGEDGGFEAETLKRHKNSYFNEHNHQQQQQQTTQDLLDLFTNLSPDPFLDLTQQPDPENNPTLDPNEDSVIRHLLEASDDELGIPSRVDSGDGGGDAGDGGGGGGDVSGGYFGDFDIGLSNGLWEIEDEVANYYTLLQCELFMK